MTIIEIYTDIQLFDKLNISNEGSYNVCYHFSPLQANLYSIQYGSVRISETNDRSVPVSRIVCHNFNATTLVNDVAVVEVSVINLIKSRWRCKFV